MWIFLSTLSLRRATQAPEHRGYPLCISIHALLAESDRHPERRTAGNRYFYPRSPCGERLFGKNKNASESQFLSTLSLRRATSHAQVAATGMAFLSTLSLRRATKERKALIADVCIFLSTLSLRRATMPWAAMVRVQNYFYPRSPCGERRWKPTH